MTEIKVHNREIDGFNYVVTKRPAMQQIKLQFEIMNIIGGGVGGVSGLDLPSKDSPPESWVALIGVVMGSTDPDKAYALMIKIIGLAPVRVDDELKPIDEIVFNSIFEDNLVSAYKVVGFVLEVQFSSFLAPLLGAYKKATQQEAKQNNETETSGGKLPLPS